MSGHSKWSTIKRKKGVADARRGKLFTRLGRDITIAAREGGGDPDTNIHLRLAMEKAKKNNMPKDNIERARKRGTGELKDGAAFEEIVYEGYGPHGVAIIIKVMTDNRNRAVADVRRTFDRAGGSLGENGCVMWMFDYMGYLIINVDGQDPEEIALMAIDAGADDVNIADDMVEVFTQPNDFNAVQKALSELGYDIETSELSYVPQTPLELDEAQARQALSLVDNLEDLDDTQNVYSNLEVSDELMAKLEEEE